MQILMLHNRYALPGGEDVSTRTEAEMLRRGGHHVDVWELTNDDISEQNMLAVSANSVWSFHIARALSARLHEKQYDVMHVQNYFPQFSPVVHRVARKHGVATIQHLRNFRYTCVNASLFRDGKSCTDCVGSFVPWQGVRHGCYRDSKAGSAVLAAMVGTHKLAGTWTKSVTRYIAISEYVRDIHIRAGVPAEKIVVRPNVVITPEVPPQARRSSVFVAARLTPEKGVQTVISAWRLARPRGHTLRIAGIGPMEGELRAIASGDPTIEFLGQLSSSDVALEMSRARLVVVPSLWAEPFGRTALEAMAVGTAVLVSDVGGLPDIVGNTSEAVVPPGDPPALSTMMIRALITEHDFLARVAAIQARRLGDLFAVDVILGNTERIYREALEERSERR